MFAAIAPISAPAPRQGKALDGLVEKVKGIPAIVLHGAGDGIVPPSNSREMVKAAKKAGMIVEHIEVAGADHVAVVAATFPVVMEFFEKHARQAQK
jgi:dipeptidyl aminopeptidase/acylaminoacyl peptidase